MNRSLRTVFVTALMLSVGALGCASTGSPPAPIPLVQAQVEIPQAELIDLVVAPFETGVPEDVAERDEKVFTEVREAESRFIASHLKQTLESSGQWGSVTVAPASDDVGLVVEGKILDSDGESLSIRVRARDATGREWLERTYSSRLPIASYRMPAGVGAGAEPFQNLYHRISNDLVKARDDLEAAERTEIGQVAELRFAANLAPDAFGGRLETDRRGRTRVLRMPAEDDSQLGHVRAVRDRDQALREALDESYASFYDEMAEPYLRWRSFTAEEQIAYRSLQREGYLKAGLGVLAAVGGLVLSAYDGGVASEILVAPLIVGGIYGATSGIQKLTESSIHVATIEELGVSFDADVAPRVVEVQGATLKIQGSAETQYREWRRLLRAIYQAETGLPVEDLDLPGLESQADLIEAAPSTSSVVVPDEATPTSSSGAVTAEGVRGGQ